VKIGPGQLISSLVIEPRWPTGPRHRAQSTKNRAPWQT
jgi:hypothetical protein